MPRLGREDPNPMAPVPGRRRGRPPAGNPNPIDVHVGSRVRLRRTLLGMSQDKLGDAIGLTFQQVQKYERGANRVGSSRLFDLARVLDVPVTYFFEEMSASRARAQRFGGMAEEAGRGFQPDPMDQARDARAGARLLPITDAKLAAACST